VTVAVGQPKLRVYWRNTTGDPVPDTYGQDVLPGQKRERLAGCRCKVPCLAFRCTGIRGQVRAHKAPWCCGGDGEQCDKCWAGMAKFKSRST